MSKLYKIDVVIAASPRISHLRKKRDRISFIVKPPMGGISNKKNTFWRGKEGLNVSGGLTRRGGGGGGLYGD